LIRTGKGRKEFLRLRERFGFQLDPDLLIGELSFAGRQQIELLRVLYHGAAVLILDEPTSFLAPREVERFLDLLRSLRADGRTILFISHRLGEIFAVADRITVLRNGKVAATLNAGSTCPEEISRLMIGAGENRQAISGQEDCWGYEKVLDRTANDHHGVLAEGVMQAGGCPDLMDHGELEERGGHEKVWDRTANHHHGVLTGGVVQAGGCRDLPDHGGLEERGGHEEHEEHRVHEENAENFAASPPLLDIRKIDIAPAAGEPGIREVTFSVQAGEVFGVGGIVGNGHRLFARALAGRTAIESGAVFFEGTDITNLPLRQRLQAGICRVPENPSEEALMQEAPLWENFLLGRQKESRFQKWGRILRKQIVEFTADQVRENAIAAMSPFQPLSSLSGGNAQKVALAKVFSTQPKLVILEQPSRGLDLHASARMHRRISDLSTKGTAFIIFSFDLDELLSTCSRIAILFRGKLKGPAEVHDVSREDLGKWMVGLS
ncbi:MAG: ATP-binding cassette domain-containing protein, partial [Syntrophobacteraceae bacterium]